jgi:hypothetical protein
MAGILDLFTEGDFGLKDSGHSRYLPGQSLEAPFVQYSVLGAAQELHAKVTQPLPYKGEQAGPIVDTQTS